MADNKIQQGRPKKHKHAHKVSVILRNDQTISLDQLALDIRTYEGVVIKRSDLIRALIDALIESKLDLHKVTSEKDVMETILYSIVKLPPDHYSEDVDLVDSVYEGQKLISRVSEQSRTEQPRESQEIPRGILDENKMLWQWIVRTQACKKTEIATEWVVLMLIYVAICERLHVYPFE